MKRKSIYVVIVVMMLLIIILGVKRFLDSKPDLRLVNPSDVIKTDNKNAPRPNIILINFDDLGYGDLGCYGSLAIKTPNIDQLAQEGMRFTDGYSCNALCSPSRFGLLTGRYPQRRGLDWPIWEAKPPVGQKVVRVGGHILGKIGLSDMGKESDVEGIPADEITLAEALRLAGYKTGMVGKWHLGDFPVLPQYHPMKHGFDQYFGVPYSNGMTPVPLYRGEEQLESDVQGQDQAKLTRLYTEEAIKFLEENRDGSFFLYFAHTFPHRPLFASEEFRYKSDGGLYGDVVEELDFYTGVLLERLKDLGLEENTIVILTSDNGPWYYGSSGGLRGGKGQSFEGGFRVPLIVRWPGQIEAGSICSEPIINLDFYPTLLNLAGLSLPSDRVIDGKDVSGILLGTKKESPHEALFFYHHDVLEGVRAGKWKYYRKINLYKYPMPVNKTFASIAAGKLSDWPLLYDLKLDPGEAYNLADNMPEMVEKMDNIMTQWELSMENNSEGWID